MGAVSLLLSSIFRGMNPSLVPDVRSAILLVGGSLALGLPASIFSGIFVGLQRNEIPAAVTGATKLLAAFFLVIAARRGGSLTAMAATWALVHLAGYCAQYLACRRLVPEITPRLFASGAAFRELLSFVASLSVWNFAMLIIGGLDVTLVAMIDYPRVPFYAVATTAVTFFIGFHGAILNALLPSAAVMHAREGAQRLGELVISTTRATTALLLFTGLPFIALAGSLLTVWVGPQYARESRLLLQLLLVANIIRLSAGAYSTALLAAGEHRRVILSPILEAGINLLVSVLAGLWLGAVGVAIGTLAGAIVSVAAHWFYNMPRTRSIAIRTGSYVLEGLVKPFVYLAPLLLLFLISNAGFTSVAVALWTATILLATTPLLLICVVGKSRTRSLLHLISASRPVESR
jgi:O-antigen/teichoic acid export membrane protein